MDDLDIQPQNNSAPTPEKNYIDNAQEKEERIFDITPDLNISPASDVAPVFTGIDTQKNLLKDTNVEFINKNSSSGMQIPREKILKDIVVNKPNKIEAPTIPQTIPNLEQQTMGSEFSKLSTKTAIEPTPTPIPKPIPAPAPVPISIPQVDPANYAPPQENPNLKNIRTYEADVAEVMSHRNISSTQIALAENKKRLNQEQIGSIGQKNSGSMMKKLLLVILILIFLIGGAGGAYYLYSISPLSPDNSQATTKTPEIKSLIPSDSYALISIDNITSPNLIVEKIKNEVMKEQPTDTIKEIIPVKTINGQYVRLTSKEILNLMDLVIPDVLARSLENSWMIGVFVDETGSKDVFIVASNNFFQNAFAGMLSWENLMTDDIKPYIKTSTTTIRGQFRDKLNSNKDVRQYTTIEGDNLYMYSFVDNSKIIVTSSDAALTEIIDRLEKQAFVR